MATSARNKQIALEAFDTLLKQARLPGGLPLPGPPNTIFNTALTSHPVAMDCSDLIKALGIATLALIAENAVTVAEGDFVILHGRFTGHGRPRAWVAADIVRMEDGILEEHWDVLQDEATQTESQSGRPMFGTSFAAPDQPAAPAAATASFTVEEARKIVTPLYEALNEPARKDVAALLAQATHSDYKSYSTNEEWLNRDQLADVFRLIGKAVPNLRWTIKDILTVGDQITVRGEASGTPTGEFVRSKTDRQELQDPVDRCVHCQRGQVGIRLPCRELGRRATTDQGLKIGEPTCRQPLTSTPRRNSYRPTARPTRIAVSALARVIPYCFFSTSQAHSTIGTLPSPIPSGPGARSFCLKMPALADPVWQSAADDCRHGDSRAGPFLDGLGLKSCDVLGFSLGGMVAQQMVLDRPDIFRRLILVGTAPRGGEDIMHLEKPVLAQHLGNPRLQGYEVLQKIFFAPTPSSQAAGAAFIERLMQRKTDREPLSGPEVAQAQMRGFPGVGVISRASASGTWKPSGNPRSSSTAFTTK